MLDYGYNRGERQAEVREFQVMIGVYPVWGIFFTPHRCITPAAFKARRSGMVYLGGTQVRTAATCGTLFYCQHVPGLADT